MTKQMGGSRRGAVTFRSGSKIPSRGGHQEEPHTTCSGLDGRAEFSLPETPSRSHLLVQTASVSARASKSKSPEPLLSLSHAASVVTVEHLRVKRITGDGRCLFRALAQGVARHKDIFLTPVKEEMEADNLRMAVTEVLCTSKEKKKPFKDLIKGIEQHEDRLPRYCRRLISEDFWGGEPELIVLAALLKVPVYVYMESEYGRSGKGFIRIVEYGNEYLTGTKQKSKPKVPVKLLFSGQNHYDLLMD